MDISITLTPDQVDAIAARVAEIITAETPSPGSEGGSRWLSPDEAADVLRCDRRRIYKLVEERSLSPHHEGRRLLLDRGEVESLVARG